MADFQGKFQYFAEGGAVAQQGGFRLHFDAQTLTLTPDSGAALAFDLGDLDAVIAGEWQIRLPLYTGKALVLSQLGKSYDNLSHDLTEAFRNRTVQCMLLEDMGEVARFSGNFELTAADGNAAGAAEIRLYKSNLAVLPVSAKSFQWRLADIDSARLDSASYEIQLQSGDSRLKISRLAKRTEEFSGRLQDAINALAVQTAQALHAMLPFLDPSQLQSCASILREGRSASLAQLVAIHKDIPAAFSANAVDKDLKPYYDQLVTRAAQGMGYVGFKLIRPESGDAANAQPTPNAAVDDDDNAPDADAAAPETLYWFLFPLAGKTAGSVSNMVAWEASSRGGRATYFFRMADGEQARLFSDQAKASALVDQSIRRLNRVLAMLNFRRRPIYLSDAELSMDPRFHRYAIAARRLPEVREVRASFLGRALHSSVDAWQSQVESIVAKK